MHILSYRTLGQLGQRKGLGGGRAGLSFWQVGVKLLEIVGLLFHVYREKSLESKKTKAWPARKETFQKPNGS